MVKESVVWEIAQSKFNRYNLSYPTVSIFNLYFIDLLLWKLYKTEDVNENLKSLKSKIDNLKIVKFDTFEDPPKTKQFVFRKPY